MPEDVRAAIDRLELFLSRFGADAVIDAQSGFSAADGSLLIGEITMALQERAAEERYPHDEG